MFPAIEESLAGAQHRYCGQINDADVAAARQAVVALLADLGQAVDDLAQDRDLVLKDDRDGNQDERERIRSSGRSRCQRRSRSGASNRYRNSRVKAARIAPFDSDTITKRIAHRGAERRTIAG